MINEHELRIIEDRLDIAKQIEIDMLQRGGSIPTMQKLMQQDIQTLIDVVKKYKEKGC